MTTDLNILTLLEFIDLACRYYDSIHSRSLSQKDMGDMRTVVMEFQEIASPGSASSSLLSNERIMKAGIVHKVMNICRHLYKCGLVEQVRAILIEFDSAASLWSAARIEGEIEMRSQRALREIEEARTEAHGSDPDSKSLRRQFYQQMASLMAHFKFQIDPATIKASVYANLIAQYSREVKAMKAAYKK